MGFCESMFVKLKSRNNISVNNSCAEFYAVGQNVENTSETSRVTPAWPAFANLRLLDNFLYRTSVQNLKKNPTIV
jgi:hypothetical protein